MFKQTPRNKARPTFKRMQKLLQEGVEHISKEDESDTVNSDGFCLVDQVIACRSMSQLQPTMLATSLVSLDPRFFEKAPYIKSTHDQQSAIFQWGDLAIHSVSETAWRRMDLIHKPHGQCYRPDGPIVELKSQTKPSQAAGILHCVQRWTLNGPD